MFQKQPKVPQYLGNSFKDFNSDYESLTKNLGAKFKNTTTSLQGQQSDELSSNARRTGTTWDSKHLDQFVANSPWATQTQTATSLHSSQQKYRLQAGDPNGQQQQQRAKTTKDPQSRGKTGDGVRESYFFSTVSRFIENEDNYRIIDFPDRYVDKNFIVSDRKDLESDYYRQNFSVSRHAPATAAQLSMSMQPSNLMNPLEKREQLKDIKKQQQEFMKWKSEYKTMNKKYRVHTRQFPSGILQVDNPCNEQSQLYSEEAKKESQKQHRKEQFKTLHKDRLSQLAQSNPQIEFLNNFSHQFAPVKQVPNQLDNRSYRFQHQYDLAESQIVSENKQQQKQVQFQQTVGPSQNLSQFIGGQSNLAVSQVLKEPFTHSNRERISANWSCKRPVTTNLLSQGKDTGDRLFGAEAKNFSIVRAKYLREQDTKKRDFNVISFVDNAIEFKQDQGVMGKSIVVGQ